MIDTSLQTLPLGSVGITRWRSWHDLKRRPSLFLDWTTGIGLTDSGIVVTAPAKAPARELVDTLPETVEQLWLCGELPCSDTAQTEAGSEYSPFHSWVIEGQPDHHYLGTGVEHDRTLARWGTVEMRPIAAWLSENECGPTEARAAMRLVERVLRTEHGWQDVFPLGTPGMTGAALWRLTFPMNKGYPILPQEARRFLRSTVGGQGRFELFAPPPGIEQLSRLICLDARFQYAACCLGDVIGATLERHDHDPDYLGFQPAQYRVSFRVPDQWGHIGLLMAPAPYSGRGERSWWWPAEPGFHSETWASAAELRIALAPFAATCQGCAEAFKRNTPPGCPAHGWLFRIHERLIYSKGRPLETWAEKVIHAREQAGIYAPTSRIGDLARAAIRNLLIHTVGLFHGADREITCTGPDAPEGVNYQTVYLASGEVLRTWQEPGPPRRFYDYDRPELSSQVWAQARARLLLHRSYGGEFTGALCLPHEQLVALRLDAIYTTTDPGWPDNDKVGVFRPKWTLGQPAPWPASETDLTVLAHIAKEQH